MATLGSPSPPSSPSRRRRTNLGVARKLERLCCSIVTYFPLAFVYGLTTWAVWVETRIGWRPSKAWPGHGSSALGVVLYILLNWSYTAAVFTDPGSPLETKGGYSNLPTHEHRPFTSFTVKSTGELRFCKKCQSRKPDRAHHCSTCRRCVLKMDHHCPWLATCVGLRNYKAFLLFLTYLTLFCWCCFAVSASWVYTEVFNQGGFDDALMPVNYILLAVISGIIGVVITGFTSWHLWLTSKGQTTIESLEKTRYLSPLRKSMQQQLSRRNYIDPATGRPSLGDQIREIHANALPGVTRPEEGEDSRSSTPYHGSGTPAQTALHRSYQDLERQRDIDRYADYLDEKDSENLPNAFDLGWKRNYGHVFGESILLWFLPLPSTTGDGWQWEASERWIDTREGIRRQRESQKELERMAGWGVDSPTSNTFPHSQAARLSKPSWRIGSEEEEDSNYLTTSTGVLATPREGTRSPGKADLILGRIPGMYNDTGETGTPLRTLDRRKLNAQIQRDLDPAFDDEDDEDEDSNDEVQASDSKKPLISNQQPTPHKRDARPPPLPTRTASNWNDVPDDFFPSSSKASDRGSRSQSRDPKRPKDGEWTDWGTK